MLDGRICIMGTLSSFFTFFISLFREPRTQYFLRCMKTKPVERVRIVFRPDRLDALSPQSQSGDRLRYARKFRAPEKAPFVREDNSLPSAYYGPHDKAFDR